MKEYFSHDIDARNDKKIAKLMFKFDWKGYGIYWGIVEFLHNNDNVINQDELPVLAKNLNCDFDILKSIVFDFELFFIEKNKIFSKRIAKNLKQQKEISKKRKEAINKRWQSKQVDTNVLQTEYKSNTIKVKESKVKESKVKEKDIIIKGNFFKKPSLEDVKIYCQERNNDVNAQTFIDFYESKGWMVGKSPMKDWRACVRTWEKPKEVANSGYDY